jgi:hypothetical protein
MTARSHTAKARKARRQARRVAAETAAKRLERSEMIRRRDRLRRQSRWPGPGPMPPSFGRKARDLPGEVEGPVIATGAAPSVATAPGTPTPNKEKP